MSTEQQTDQRPPVWVGHISMSTNALAESTDAMLKIGMRPIAQGESVTILELRGGTHLVLRGDGAEPGDAEFDLMVDDVDATHADYSAKGLNVSEITRGRIHDSFTFTEPGGNRITVNSTHASDQPV